MTRRLAAAALLSISAVAFPGAQTGQTGQGAEVRIYQPGRDAGVEWPRVVRDVRPRYTPEGMRARIQGVVAVSAVVMPDGTVRDAYVTRSLDSQFGLDAAALAAARAWRFEPARIAATGEAVASRVAIELEFRIHRDSEEAAAAGPRPAAGAPTQAFADQPSLVEFEAGAYREGTEGVVAPAVRREVRPSYTPAAMAQKIEGTVAVDVVVNPDGRVARARLAGSLDPTYGLDRAALAAAREWLFEPGTGTLNGVAVPVITRLTIEFRIH